MDKENDLLSLVQILKEVVDQSPSTEELTVNFKYLEDLNTVVAFIGKLKVGALRLKPYQEGFQVDSVTVSPSYRQLGIGKEMYRVAFETVHSLYSDEYQTPDAKRIWDSLINSGEAVKVGQRYKMI